MGSRLKDLVASISNVKSRKQFDILVQLYLDVLPPLSVKVTSAGPMDVNEAQGIIMETSLSNMHKDMKGNNK
jgi:hypothetical protein